MTSTIILKVCTVIHHGYNASIRTTVADILIEVNSISKIASSISASGASTHVVDCSSYIVSPGFIDTHRHTWQSQLKGRHIDHTFVEYMPTGNSAFFPLML